MGVRPGIQYRPALPLLNNPLQSSSILPPSLNLIPHQASFSFSLACLMQLYTSLHKLPSAQTPPRIHAPSLALTVAPCTDLRRRHVPGTDSAIYLRAC
eukprot:2036045-Rhodomonas_salina.3